MCSLIVCSRVGGCNESSLVAANILFGTLIKPKSAQKVCKSTGNQPGLGLEDLLLDFPYVQGQLTEVPLNFDIFVTKVVGQPI